MNARLESFEHVLRKLAVAATALTALTLLLCGALMFKTRRMERSVSAALSECACCDDLRGTHHARQP
jgi:hypothetical protein